MKKVHLLVLKAFIGPFIVTFFIVMFVLLMLFLFKYIDDLIGKGFEWHVLLRLMFYASATNVAMALPLAILLSSIMTFGSLGENYELVAIKSIGISLQKAMRPMIITVTLLSIGAFLFSDYMLPVANLKFQSLMYDVRNQKAAFLINEGVFNNSIPGYSMRVSRKGSDGQTLYGVMIYDHSSNNGAGNVLIAKEGKMYQTDDDKTLVLLLKDGVRYEETHGDKGMYNPRQRFTRSRFKETEQKFDLSTFKMQRTDEDLFKSNFAMLNLRQLGYYIDSTQVVIDSMRKTVYPAVQMTAKENTIAKGYTRYKPEKAVNYTDITEQIPGKFRETSIATAQQDIMGYRQALVMKVNQDEDYSKRITRFIIEYNRKFTLSVSCLILFFIGAPLGAIIRKGGLGLPVVMAVIFFLIYHIISTIGEKSAKEGDMSPVFGMWLSIVALAPLGAFLTYKASVDSVLFDIDFYKNWVKKLFTKKEASA